MTELSLLSNHQKFQTQSLDCTYAPVSHQQENNAYESLKICDDHSVKEEEDFKEQLKNLFYLYIFYLLQIISGNTDTETVVSHRLMPTVYATKVRILPYSIHRRTICLRVEVKGCPAEGKQKPNYSQFLYNMHHGKSYTPPPFF